MDEKAEKTVGELGEPKQAQPEVKPVEQKALEKVTSPEPSKATSNPANDLNKEAAAEGKGSAQAQSAETQGDKQQPAETQAKQDEQPAEAEKKPATKSKQQERDIVKIINASLGVFLLIFTLAGVLFLVYLFLYEAEPNNKTNDIGFPVVRQQQYEAAKQEYVLRREAPPANVDGSVYYDPFRLFRREEATRD